MFGVCDILILNNKSNEINSAKFSYFRIIKRTIELCFLYKAINTKGNRNPIYSNGLNMAIPI